jgi:oligopeptide transport system substrate-binding protein
LGRIGSIDCISAGFWKIRETFRNYSRIANFLSLKKTWLGSHKCGFMQATVAALNAALYYKIQGGFKMKVKRGALVFSLLGSLAIGSLAKSAGLSVEQRRQANEVYVNLIDEPPSLDPTKQADSVSSMWLGHIYEGLMSPDASGKNYVPAAAESVSVSPDGLVYTFKIRKNAKWHDGKAVSAKDFEFAFRRLVDPKFASEYSFIATTAQIVGADEIIKGKLPTSELGAKAINDSTFEVKLKNPIPFFKSLMSFQVFYPVRQDIVQKFGDKFAANADSVIGNGPFKLTKWVHESSMRVEKVPTYWNAANIKLNAIEAPVLLKDYGALYSQIVTGALDMTWLDRDRLKLAQKDKKAISNYSDGSVWWLEMNQRKGQVFSNLKARQALKYVVNRAEIANKVVAIPGTKPAFGIVPDYMFGSKAGLTFRKESKLQWKDADLATAKKYISEYLAETKQKKFPSFTILGDDTGPAKIQMEYLQGYLKKALDADVKIDTVPFKTRLQRTQDGQFDIVWAGWGPDYLDSMTFMDLMLSTNENNHGKFADPKFDKMIYDAQKEANIAKRAEILIAAEKYLIEDQAALVPLYQRNRAYMSTEGLKGFNRLPVGADPDLRFAYWKK